MISNNSIFKSDVKASDSFKIVSKALTLFGYYEIDPRNGTFVKLLHRVYRYVIIFMICVYNMQHIIFLFMSANDAAFWDCLVIAIPQMNLFVKVLTLFVNTSRIRRLRDILDDPIFSATNKKDEEFLLKNSLNMLRLFKLLMGSILSGTFIWALSYIVRRIENPNFVIASYFPFDTRSWKGYSFSIIAEITPIIWTGFGHFAVDCVIATYYAQATVQVKILKYNLEHMFDVEKCEIGSIESFKYIDDTDEDIKKRFVYYVNRHAKVFWFIDEISSVFDKAISAQVFTTSIISCLAAYNMQVMSVFSVPFMFMFILVILYNAQICLYCFFGHLVQYESQSINTAVYFSDWLSLSPRFRRLILIAMLRWGRPCNPRVSGVVDVTLVTFVAIIRASYSLYTVMKTTSL